MAKDFKVTMNEYLPLRDVVFNTPAPGDFKGRTGAGRAPDGNPAGGAAGSKPYSLREAIRKLELEGLC